MTPDIGATTAFPNFIVKEQLLSHWFRTETKHGDHIEVIKTDRVRWRCFLIGQM